MLLKYFRLRIRFQDEQIKGLELGVAGVTLLIWIVNVDGWAEAVVWNFSMVQFIFSFGLTASRNRSAHSWLN